MNTTDDMPDAKANELVGKRMLVATAHLWPRPPRLRGASTRAAGSGSGAARLLSRCDIDFFIFYVKGPRELFPPARRLREGAPLSTVPPVAPPPGEAVTPAVFFSRVLESGGSHFPTSYCIREVA